MFTKSGKGWLGVLLGALLLGSVPVQAIDPVITPDGEVIAVPDQPQLFNEPRDFRAGEPSAAGPGMEIEDNGDETISVTFEEPEQDILTRRALDKLDVIVESLEFANADLRNVIRIIGERLDINFIFDAEDIQGKVTLRLRNIRLRDALDSILSTRQLAIIPDASGIFRIVPQERVGKKLVETRTEVIQLNWINAADVARTMAPFISDGVGKMQANEESNALIITDVPPQIEIIRNLITEIDIPERQVMIEARLADVNIGAARELSTNWSLSKENIEDWQPSSIGASDINPEGGFIPELIGPGVSDPLGVVNNLLDGFSMKGGAGTLALGETVSIFGNTYSMNMVFEALEQRNVVEILANPRVTTLNNVPAKIKIVERIPYIEAVTGPSQGTLTQEVEFEEAGVEIGVKPIITPNGFVRLEVVLEQRIFRQRVGGGALDPPAIDVRNADTNVIVEDRSTVVLGGLRQQRRLEGMSGLPWLHRIPLFGWLFKDKVYDNSKNELMLMLTPTIVHDKIALNDRERYFYDKIDNDWHLPDYFFDETKSLTDPIEARDVPDVE